MTPLPDLEPAEFFRIDTPVKTPFVQNIVRSLAETLWIPEGMTDAEMTIRAGAAFTAWAAFAPSDPVEQMLAVQAVGAHHAAMECFRRAMMPEVGPDITDRLRTSAARMGRMMRDTLKALTAYRARPMPAQHPAEQALRPEDAPTPVEVGAPVAEPAQTPMHPEDVPTPAARVASAGRPAKQRRGWDPREKAPNGDPMRDFMSRRFGPEEDMEAAWETAVRESALLEEAELDTPAT